ncbi:YetF domain-containing protein [Clostridium brassicae]|uniref:DUF421 domain-containing protein n=1 Tax=Clostridium brassicae TaxID=2999072 RepID=A0ABT4DDG8_9CLOT|nr:DUF421 domain-containing protein [Clostridium brassicae]MCY6960355.1 DUF421 domain-containing protein [Clostridium brassicae]
MIIEIFNTIVKTTIAFSISLLIARILGKKQMSHSTFFNYITGITIGSIVANMTLESNTYFIKGVVSLLCWCLLTSIIGFICLKSVKLRVILDGEPTIIIKKGEIIEKALYSTQLNLDDLSMMLRNKDIFSIKEVEYAILEPDGKLSVLKKQEEKEVTKKDMSIVTTSHMYIPTELVVDGKLLEHNLKELNLTKEWLYTQLKNSGINSIKQAFYIEIQSDGTLYIQKKGV